MGRYSGKTCRLLFMLSMTASFFLVEIIVGYITNSIALVADSFHMLSDVVALIVGFASVRISKWRTQRNTFGWVRAEVLGALVNSVFLMALCFSILVESLKRFVELEHIQNPKLLLIVGSIGLLINLIGLGLFHNHGHSHGGGGHGHSHGGSSEEPSNHVTKQQESQALMAKKAMTNGSVTITCDAEMDQDIEADEMTVEFDKNRLSSSAQLNMRAVFLHVLGDALGSVIVIISALCIMFIEHEWVYYLDPAMSVMLVIIILSTTIPLLKQSALILMQTVPGHIKVTSIQEKLEQIEGVKAVHEFHVWQLTGHRIIASAHVQCQSVQEYMKVAGKIKDMFHMEGIHSTTIQPEFIEDDTDSPSASPCMLECVEKHCVPKTCCGTPKVVEKNPEQGMELSPNEPHKRVSNQSLPDDQSPSSVENGPV